MSKSVDQRIVQMQFNNRQFESGVKESIGSLNNLKKGLDLKSAAQGLERLGAVSRTLSLGSLADSVGMIAGRFSTLGIMGVTALANIVNSAVNAGKQIVKALTIDPIRTGLSEYELKMGAIQTMMAGSGESLETVNKKLAELNAYSDQTIYSFADMTQNIGKFTNAGVSLDDAVAAIKGIANEAALSGANANEAARAMYNLSQAMSMGYVQLIDWKSIEMANMGTVDFKENLLKTAVAMKVIKKNNKGLYITPKGQVLNAMGMFKDGLQDQWLTSKVLLKTLAKYTDTTTDLGKRATKAATEIKTLSQMYGVLKESAQSGWAATWEIVSGNFDEAKALYTELNDIFGKMITTMEESRNSLLQGWKDLGGRTKLIEAFRNIIFDVGKILKPIKEAFQDIFPPLTAQRLMAFTEGLVALTKKLELSSEGAITLRRIFKGVFALVNIAKMFFVELAKGLGILLGRLKPAGDGLLKFTLKVADWLVKLNDTIKTGKVFQKAMASIIAAIDWVALKIKEGIKAIRDFFQSLSQVDLSGFTAVIDKIKERFGPLGVIIAKAAQLFKFLIGELRKAAPIIRSIMDAIGRTFEQIQIKIAEFMDKVDFNMVFDAINAGLFTALLFGFNKFMSIINGGAGKTIKTIENFTKQISSILDSVRQTFEAYQTKLKADVLMKIAIAIGILAAALFVLSMIDSTKLTYALAAITGLFANLFASMAIFNKTLAGSKGLMSAATGLVIMSIAILILAGAMKKIADIEIGDLTKATITIGIMIAGLLTSAKVLSANTGAIMKGAFNLIFFATALTIMTKAVKILGGMDPDELTRGLIGVAVLLAELALFMAATNMTKMSMSTSTGILILAASLSILSSAVAKLGNMDSGALTRGLVGLGVVLGELLVFMKLLGDSKKLNATAFGMMVLSGAMLIFSIAIANIGSLSVEQIAKGLGALAIVLAAIVFATNNLPKDLLIKSMGIFIIANALLVLSNALTNMGGMSWEAIGKSLTILAGSLTLIVIAMQFMTAALPGAAALLIVAGALVILATVMTMLGALSLPEIGLALLALVGIFTVLGVAAYVLGPAVLVIVALAGAIALLGVGILAVGAGLMFFSTGLLTLAIAGKAGVTIFVSIVKELLDLIPYAVKRIVEGIVIFAQRMAASAPIFAESFKTMLFALLKMLIEITPVLLAALMFMLRSLIDSLLANVPYMVDAGYKLIIGILNGIAANIEGVVTAGINIVLGVVRGITKKLPAIIDAAFQLLISFLNGLAEAIRKNSDKIYNACANLVDAIIDALKKLVWKFAGAGRNLIQGIIDGIKEMTANAVRVAKETAGKVLQGIKDFLGIKSPSKEGAEIGRYLDEGFAQGLKKYGSLATDQASDVGSGVVGSLSKAVSNISDTLNSDMDMNPTIRPVMDLTNIQKGADQVNSMLPKNQSIDISATKTTAAIIGSDASPELTQTLVTMFRDLKDSIKGTIEGFTVPAPQINFNGQYSFGDKDDIRFFMNQAALLVQRRRN